MKYLTFLILMIVFIVPALVFGQGTGLIPDCSWFECTFQEHILGPNGLINKLMGWIVLIAVPAASIAIMWAGIQMVLSPTNPSKREDAKKMLKIALWGLVVVLGSYVFVKTLTDFFVDKNVVDVGLN